MIEKIINWFKTPCKKDPEIQAFLRYADEVQRQKDEEERKRLEENNECLPFDDIGDWRKADDISAWKKIWIEDLRYPLESGYQVIERKGASIVYYHKAVNADHEVVMELMSREASTYGLDWIAYRRKPNWYPQEDREK